MQTRVPTLMPGEVDDKASTTQDVDVIIGLDLHQTF